jgi:quercetin dioxygenase-like cupin family protein
VSRFLVLEADPDTGVPRIRVLPVPDYGPISVTTGESLTEPIGPAQPESAPLDLSAFGIQVAPGRLCWTVFRQQPGEEYALHHTDTIDVDTVLAGLVTLRAGGAEAELRAGDCVLVLGAAHAWTAGPSGCVLSVAFIGVQRA